jgi:hypothetical protein
VTGPRERRAISDEGATHRSETVLGADDASRDVVAARLEGTLEPDGPPAATANSTAAATSVPTARRTRSPTTAMGSRRSTSRCVVPPRKRSSEIGFVSAAAEASGRIPLRRGQWAGMAGGCAASVAGAGATSWSVVRRARRRDRGMRAVRGCRCGCAGRASSMWSRECIGSSVARRGHETATGR